MPTSRHEYLHAVVLGIILSICAVVGDLIESLFKREAGVKDSGRLFPGIGGILDLLDSLLFNAPIMYLYLRHILTRRETNQLTGFRGPFVRSRPAKNFVFMPIKNVVVLGSTGSIGTSTIKVAEDLPDRIRLVGLAAGNNVELLLRTNSQTSAGRHFHSGSGQRSTELQAKLGGAARFHRDPKAWSSSPPCLAADIVLIAIVGTAGLQPALAAIRAGKDIAIASKEILVMAGETVMTEARQARRASTGGRQRTFGHFPMPGRETARFGAAALAHSFRRSISDDPEGPICQITVERALKHPVVGDGTEDHDRFGDAVQQRDWR